MNEIFSEIFALQNPTQDELGNFISNFEEQNNSSQFTTDNNNLIDKFPPPLPYSIDNNDTESNYNELANYPNQASGFANNNNNNSNNDVSFGIENYVNERISRTFDDTYANQNFPVSYTRESWANQENFKYPNQPRAPPPYYPNQVHAHSVQPSYPHPHTPQSLPHDATSNPYPHQLQNRQQIPPNIHQRHVNQQNHPHQPLSVPHPHSQSHTGYPQQTHSISPKNLPTGNHSHTLLRPYHQNQPVTRHSISRVNVSETRSSTPIIAPYNNNILQTSPYNNRYVDESHTVKYPSTGDVSDHLTENDLNSDTLPRTAFNPRGNNYHNINGASDFTSPDSSYNNNTYVNTNHHISNFSKNNNAQSNNSNPTNQLERANQNANLKQFSIQFVDYNNFQNTSTRKPRKSKILKPNYEPRNSEQFDTSVISIPSSLTNSSNANTPLNTSNPDLSNNFKEITPTNAKSNVQSEPSSSTEQTTSNSGTSASNNSLPYMSNWKTKNFDFVNSKFSEPVSNR